MHPLLRSMNTSHNRGSSLNMSGISENGGEDEAHGNLYFQQGSLLPESTIQRYNRNDDSSDSQQQINLNNNQAVTRKHPTKGLQHHYDQERSFLSRFLLGFKRCYNCGDPTHFRTQDCPSANSVNFDKMIFLQKYRLINLILKSM